MSRITEKQLINRIKGLKEIKPREEWAILLKSQILSESKSEPVKIPAQLIGILDLIGRWSLGFGVSKKIAYSFALALFLIVGVFGFASRTMPGDLLFPIKKIAEQSQSALTGQTNLRQDAAILNSRINDLARAAKQGKINNIPSAISEVDANASVLAKNLKDNPSVDSKTIKDIAISLKTLASVPGTDLTENSAVKDLYQTVVENQIKDLQKTTLTDDQQEILKEAEDLYGREKYTDALEKILLINK